MMAVSAATTTTIIKVGDYVRTIGGTAFDLGTLLVVSHVTSKKVRVSIAHVSTADNDGT